MWEQPPSVLHFNPHFSGCVGVGFTWPEGKEQGAPALHGSVLTRIEELLDRGHDALEDVAGVSEEPGFAAEPTL